MNKKDEMKKDTIKENQLTYDDYAALDGEDRYELVQGQLDECFTVNFASASQFRII